MSDEQKTTAVAAWQGFVDLAVVQNPNLKDKLTVAAASQMMALPDSSFGWSAGGELPKAAKALAVITTLKYELTPGSGAVFFLGTAVYLSTAARRQIANTGRFGFKWMTPRVPRPLNDGEKEMLGWEEGDRALALDVEIMVNGERMPVVGYAIIERARLEKTVGAQTKAFLYNTLFTRAERDILKRYLPLDVPEAPDKDEQEVIQATVIDTGGSSPADDQRKEKEEADRRAMLEAFMGHAKKLGTRKVKSLGININDTFKWTTGDIENNLNLVLDEIRAQEAAKKDAPATETAPEPAESTPPAKTQAELLSDANAAFEKRNGKPEVKPEAIQQQPGHEVPTAKLEAPASTKTTVSPAYMTISKYIDKMKAPATRELLKNLGQEMLYEEDASVISAACRMILDGQESEGVASLSTLYEGRRMPM